jgi:hypothetical protein
MDNPTTYYFLTALVILAMFAFRVYQQPQHWLRYAVFYVAMVASAYVVGFFGFGPLYDSLGG